MNSPAIPNPTMDVLLDVSMERRAQNEKWGVQNRPDGTDESFKAEADLAKEICNTADDLGELTWRQILTEEVFEAFAETDKAELREELVQVAAVAVNWIENIDRDANA